MDPDKVIGAAQPAADRVGVVVAVDEGIVIVGHCSAGTSSGSIRPAVFPAGLIHPGEICLDGLGDRVGPVEGTDNPGLGERITLHSAHLHDSCTLSIAGRP